jgi:hypothetical protein
MEREDQSGFREENQASNGGKYLGLRYLYILLFVPMDLINTTYRLGNFGEYFTAMQTDLLCDGACLSSVMHKQERDAVVFRNGRCAGIEVKTITLSRNGRSVAIDPSRFDFLVLVVIDGSQGRVFVLTRKDLEAVCEKSGVLVVSKSSKGAQLCEVVDKLLQYENNWSPILKFGTT